MKTAHVDDRTAERLARDEAIAAEPKLAPPNVPAGATPSTVEVLLRHNRRPVAVAGVVENGLVRPIDPSVRLPEQSRVIIVATEPA